MDEDSDNHGAKLSDVDDSGDRPARQGKASVAARVARGRDEPQPSDGTARQERLAQWGAWRLRRRAAMRRTLIATATKPDGAKGGTVGARAWQRRGVNRRVNIDGRGVGGPWRGPR